ncbi:saccharopine dehydrogenase NADP-binding domain-containing protein [Streptomyces sp. NPDC056254]|uniref:saccharopine dehydrogenase NADP-binding domain-containing protein n=1 Tax=unclassified Streptomyces TaxID=2593676 RepID=UPI001626607D|nr:saccharopine dehydrogenase NADP-binding domain-containing protein [Streptomyces sp. INR7]QNE24096.1 saccharopine dehydrogenase [Streptomyces sp. INR7]
MTTVKSGSEGRVLVVGGYGAVGATVTSTLAEWFPGRVVPSGRDAVKARRLGGVRVDAGDLAGFRQVLDELGDVRAVVLCIEPEDAGLARICLERGIHLVDVGATHRLLEKVTDLNGLAAAAGATAVLSVGVAPGLTNLLARRVNDAVGGADRIDLTVLLGAGERHGTDAVRWTVAGLSTPVTARPNQLALPGFGLRTAHSFPFSDQYTLRRTLGVPEVTTRLCLDSRPLTAALFALRRAGLLRGARGARQQQLLTSAFSRVHLGGDRFAVRADAYRGDHHATLALTGQGQSRATGLVAAHVVRALFTRGVPAGVHHVEQLTALAELPEQLAAHGITAAA